MLEWGMHKPKRKISNNNETTTHIYTWFIFINDQGFIIVFVFSRTLYTYQGIWVDT